MVLIQTATGAFCVDSTEVTVKHYDTWLSSSPKLPQLDDPECGWKASGTYLPRTSEGTCGPEHFDPKNKPDHPVVCVDWCDARQYCKGVGKRLCGAVEGGGPIGFDQPKTWDVDELTYACSGGGKRIYPHGNSPDEKACVGDLYDGVDDGEMDNALPVKSAIGCEGGLPGLHDMVGNVWEWQNSCNTLGIAQEQMCGAHGGSFWDDQSSLVCTSMYKGFTRKLDGKNIGFRCCADALP